MITFLKYEQSSSDKHLRDGRTYGQTDERKTAVTTVCLNFLGGSADYNQ